MNHSGRGKLHTCVRLPVINSQTTAFSADPLEVIEYGNPDNSDAGDLKGHNQVYIRGEAYIGWAILIPKAFALIAAGASA